ncbi:hypothetical protein [Celeribacter halophilus]|uniref:hypothetical protein n=1 Tax=Celeribacter halophilus TaxID=576117 RepID=UPI001113E4A6|nr:hypothetical protein [Celeribacter halophilus]
MKNLPENFRRGFPQRQLWRRRQAGQFSPTLKRQIGHFLPKTAMSHGKHICVFPLQPFEKFILFSATTNSMDKEPDYGSSK